MSAEELRQRVRSISGVASAEVSIGPDNEPMVRVWTDGSRPEQDVQEAVEMAMAEGNGDSDPSEEKSIQEQLENRPTGNAAAPVIFAPTTQSFSRLAVEESAEGVEVRASDGSGRSTFATVGEGSEALNEAVASAVALLHGLPEPLALQMDTRAFDGTEIFTALIDLPSGDRTVGAVVVSGGQLFTLGQAVDAALSRAK